MDFEVVSINWDKNLKRANLIDPNAVEGQTQRSSGTLVLNEDSPIFGSIEPGVVITVSVN